jgi:acetyl-CoA carboxylase carboxyltransferase component
MRKAYGGAYIALASKEMAYDYVLSWPSAEIAVMGAEQAVNLIHRKEIAADKTNKKRNEYIKQYQKQFLNPDEAARTGKIDKIIDPEETRIHLIRAIELLEGKRVKGTGLKASTARKHGNIPL